jgi:hypothetical protein
MFVQMVTVLTEGWIIVCDRVSGRNKMKQNIVGKMHKHVESTQIQVSPT